MISYNRYIFLACKSRLKFHSPSLNHWNPMMKGQCLSTFTKTEVTIPVPITGGHIAAQLWEGEKCSKSLASSYPTPILFMHGFQDNSSSFDPLIPLIIQNNMTIVSVDQPGHGLSSHSKSAGYDFLLDGLSTIYRVIRHFRWTKVTLIGHSYGSILSFIFTGANVDKVHKYVAIENIHPISRDTVFQLGRTFKALFDVEAKLTDPNKVQPSYKFEEIVQRTIKGRKGTVSEDGVRTLLRRGAVLDPETPGLYQFSHDLKTNIPSMFGRFTNDESLYLAGHIKCPVCVIKGDPGEDYEPREKFMKTVDAIKTSNDGKLEFHLVPGTHHLHLNDPSSVAPIITNFLNKKF